jgi:hypothetical protein
MTGIGQLLEALPAGTTFDLAPDQAGLPTRPKAELAGAVESVPAAYSPDCLSTCELGFHCRSQARCDDRVEQLGRGVRGELGSIRTVTGALAAAEGGPGRATDAESDEAAARLSYAARLRAEALAAAGGCRG